MRQRLLFYASEKRYYEGYITKKRYSSRYAVIAVAMSRHVADAQALMPPASATMVPRHAAAPAAVFERAMLMPPPRCFYGYAMRALCCRSQRNMELVLLP